MYFGSPPDIKVFNAPEVFPVVRYVAAVPLFIIVILWTSYFKHILYMTYSSNKLQKVETKSVAWTAFQPPLSVS